MNSYRGLMHTINSEGMRLPKTLSIQTHHVNRTSFDPHPKVGNRHVDLLQLYKTVRKNGGYDRVSAEKLLWRKIGQDFNLGVQNLPALAFSLKTVYYKNLA
jgi:chromatin structure-remodeling complex subunit RSC9